MTQKKEVWDKYRVQRKEKENRFSTPISDLFFLFQNSHNFLDVFFQTAKIKHIPKYLSEMPKHLKNYVPSPNQTTFFVWACKR